MSNSIRDTVVILTSEFDPHTDIMVQILSKRGANVLRFDPGDFPRHSTISMLYESGAWSYTLTHRAGVFDLGRAISVWVRRPTPWTPEISDDSATSEFVRAERDQVLQGLWKSLKAFWISDLSKIRVAEFKPLQLSLASSLGLAVPKTLITNDPNEVESFMRECRNDVIYKPFTSRIDHPDGTVYTSLVTDSHMTKVETVRTAPCLFQERIPKEFEVRTTVVGGNVFSAAIFSQEHEAGKQDWRRVDNSDLRLEPYELPASVEAKILKLVSELGLTFGAIDMIVTPDGEHVFLEINPVGQFGFVEMHTGLPIFSAVADLLMSGGHEKPTDQSLGGISQ